MKKLVLLFILFCSFGIQLFAQSDSAKIANIYSEILLGIENGDFSKSFDYSYPKIFELVPRKVMEEAVTQMLNQEGMEIGFLENEIKSIRPIGEIDGTNYQKVVYRSKMFIKVESESDSTSSFMETMLRVNLNKTFGSENVSYDELDNRFIIDANKIGLAVLDTAYDGWKVLTIEPHMAPILEKFIPEEILNQVLE
ncbi:hypothetical protein SAMN06298216_4016 [Spirosomataceae bacterium TFI 002]|nr:hypothetical protein SAMN06298216_4016 [Spirosomataceae bacterium TFI 002]